MRVNGHRGTKKWNCDPTAEWIAYKCESWMRTQQLQIVSESIAIAIEFQIELVFRQMRAKRPNNR